MIKSLPYFLQCACRHSKIVSQSTRLGLGQHLSEMTGAQLWPSATEMTGNNRQTWLARDGWRGRGTDRNGKRERERANEDAPSGCRRIYHGCRQATAASAAAAAEGRDLDRICRRSGYLRGADF